MFYEELKKWRIRQKLGSPDPGLVHLSQIWANVEQYRMDTGIYNV
jgi:hypothetical protein